MSVFICLHARGGAVEYSLIMLYGSKNPSSAKIFRREPIPKEKRTLIYIIHSSF